jgi:hypothetical protein
MYTNLIRKSFQFILGAINMDDGTKLLQLMDAANDGKREFLEYLNFTDSNITEEAFYDEIVSWDEDKVMRFVKWWDWDLNTIEMSVWEYCELVMAR